MWNNSAAEIFYCVFEFVPFSEILVGRDREKSGNIDCVFSAFRCSKRLSNLSEVPSKKVAELDNKCLVYLSQS